MTSQNGASEMPRTTRPSRTRGRASQPRHHIALVLLAVLVGAFAGGCVLDHDPRDDGSRHVVTASSARFSS